MLHRLRRAGLRTETFGYAAALEDFDAIVIRLQRRLSALAMQGEYMVVGHSLGGVLLRAALTTFPKDAGLPRHAFLLGSPLKEARLATRFQRNLLFRVLAGDCGQLLGSPGRMGAIAALSIPTTAVVGVKGFQRKFGPFGMEMNDGVVSVSEVVAPWLANQIQVQVVHTLLPSSQLVANIILRVVREIWLADRLG
ncbi:hypothetical protein R0381_003170 [Jeongeupia wiesaeckerbachi]|uniref:hypothetical protein n=1 Tax=Jeongeupia wiesaeckerbachi TaxID=3051218 RepID=UPI003D809DF8